MELARNASEKSEDFQTLVKYLQSIDATLTKIHEALSGPSRSRTDQDIEQLAIYYLHQGSGNISEVVRQLKNAGFKVRRASLTTADKYRNFQDALESYKRTPPRSGFHKDDGTVEAED